MITALIENLQSFTDGLPAAAQWAGVAVAAAVPFVESYFGSAIGVLAGIWIPLAVVAAIVGNGASMLAFVYAAHGGRRAVVRHRDARRESSGTGRKATTATASPRRQRVVRAMDRFGVPGVSLLGQTILPSQLTAAAMVSAGADRDRVVFWQLISITLWACVFAVLASLGLTALG